ncbi:MAG: hypothetical protein AAF560_33365 [Acidobacteriota bacterium]
MSKSWIRLMLAAAIACGLWAVPSTAAPPFEIHRIYYHDAAHTQYAGERTTLCGGSLVVDGVITSHVEIWRVSCH